MRSIQMPAPACEAARALGVANVGGHDAIQLQLDLAHTGGNLEFSDRDGAPVPSGVPTDAGVCIQIDRSRCLEHCVSVGPRYEQPRLLQFGGEREVGARNDD
jgi:hypothetical protein